MTTHLKAVPINNTNKYPLRQQVALVITGSNAKPRNLHMKLNAIDQEIPHENMPSAPEDFGDYPHQNFQGELYNAGIILTRIKYLLIKLSNFFYYL